MYFLLKCTFLDIGQGVNLIIPGWCPVVTRERTTEGISWQSSNIITGCLIEYINIFFTYNGLKKKLSETYTKTAIVSTHPISHIVASMSALWSTLGSTFSAVSSFDDAFRFLFVLITCWSLIFPMLIYIYRVINDPTCRLLSVWNYISPKFAGVFDMTFNTTGEDDQDWTNKVIKPEDHN